MDLRDTLNRRRDQECSQQSVAQIKQQESDPKGQRKIPIEDLHHTIAAMERNDEELIATAMGSPFWEIREAKLPKEFKLLTIKAYKGKSNPKDHLDHFNDLMELHLVSKMAKCRVFFVTMMNGTKKWLKVIPPRSIANW